MRARASIPVQLGEQETETASPPEWTQHLQAFPCGLSLYTLDWNFEKNGTTGLQLTEDIDGGYRSPPFQSAFNFNLPGTQAACGGASTNSHPA